MVIILLVILHGIIADQFLLQTYLAELHILCLQTTTIIVMADENACHKCPYTMLQLLKPLLREEIRGAQLFNYLLLSLCIEV